MRFMQILTLAILLSSSAGCAVESSDAPFSLGKSNDGSEPALAGNLESVWMGSLHPVHVLGEHTCLLFIRNTEDQLLYGLIEPYDDCQYAPSLELGTSVSVPWSRLRLASERQVDLLSEIDPSVLYYHLE